MLARPLMPRTEPMSSGWRHADRQRDVGQRAWLPWRPSSQSAQGSIAPIRSSPIDARSSRGPGGCRGSRPTGNHARSGRYSRRAKRRVPGPVTAPRSDPAPRLLPAGSRCGQQQLRPLSAFADVILTPSVASASPFDAATPAMALVEALITALVDQMGDAPRERMSRYDALHGGAVDGTNGEPAMWPEARQ